MRAEGERRSDPGPREVTLGHRDVPDSLAFGSASGMTGESFARGARRGYWNTSLNFFFRRAASFSM
jgi:hypothetical protein